MKTRMRWVAEFGAYAANSIAVQALAIIVLPPAEYGRFAFIYLIYALFASFMMSIVSEPWSRQGREAEWSDYSAVMIGLTVLSAMVALSAFFTGLSVLGAALGVVGVGASVYRAGARFYSAASREHRYLIGGDAAGAVVTVLAWWILAPLSDDIIAVLGAWAAGAVASCLLSRAPKLGGWTSVLRWRRTHRGHIAPLVIDSVLLDAGGIGIPMALAPAMGLANFGLYRSLTNLVVPVRLLLMPVRPLISHWSPSRLLSARVIGLVAGCAVLVGAVVGVALWAVGQSGFASGSTLAAAAEQFSLAVGVFAMANLIGMFYSFVSRIYLPPRRLLMLRVVQLVGVATGSFGGYAIAGLPGAIWGLVAAMCIHAVVVVSMNMWHARHVP